MRRFNALVFDDVLAVGASTVTPCRYDGSLGRFDTLGIHVVVDDATVAGTLSIYVESSGDGRNWCTKSAGSPFMQVSITVGTTTTKAAVETGAELSMGYVRLRLASGTGSARVKLYATARDGAG
jgi:hypothetical protein